jgi:hypothetical protein
VSDWFAYDFVLDIHLINADGSGFTALTNQWMERVDRERQLRGTAPSARGTTLVTGLSEGAPTFAFRLGVPVRSALPSPRRPVEAVVRQLAVRSVGRDTGIRHANAVETLLRRSTRE